jgi:drug/metabolite transporter (DMT)-like permease
VSAAPDGFALLAGGLWGTSDFVGGTMSRRLRTMHVLAASQAVSAVLALALPVVPGLGSVEPGWFGWSVAAGVAWALAMGAFYTALALGTMGVVAPIASAGAILPVAVGLLAGERPGLPALAGVVVTVAGIVAAAGPELDTGGDAGGNDGRRRAMVLAVLAALLFGVEICCLARGSTASVAMTLVGMRLSALACTLLALAPTRRPGRHRMPGVRPAVRDVPGFAMLGVLDVAATLAYALASRTGLMSLAAVLASSYPAVTVVLARQVHGERLRPVQVAGVVAVLAGAAGIGLANVA